MKTELEKFVGTWRLISYVHVCEKGTKIFPMGQNVQGQLIYSADGFMSAILHSADRPLFHSNSLYGGSDQERLKATYEFVSYAGSYRLEGDRIIHTVSSSFFPNWIGTEQTRFYEFNGKRLTLSTRLYTENKESQKAVLVWERASII